VSKHVRGVCPHNAPLTLVCYSCRLYPHARLFYEIFAMHVQRLEWSCTTGDDSPATLQ
jgi:hypothetical protein